MILNKNAFAFVAILFNSFLFSQTDTATINFVDFNATATYGIGSGISVHFDPEGIYKFENQGDDNQFVLELSQPGGAFTPPIVLSTVEAFFTTTINGQIPAGTAAGSYNLRIRATKGILVDGTSFGEVLSVSSAAFDIVTTASSQALFYSLIPPGQNLFDCTVEGVFDTNPMFGSLKMSSGDTSNDINELRRLLEISNHNVTKNYSLRRINTETLSSVDLGTVAGSSYTIANDLPIGTYNYELEAEVGGISSVYTAVFVLHKSTTVLANDTNENVCVGRDVEFNIDVSSDGIGLNYKGSYYALDFGDNSPIKILTHAELLFDNNISHEYSEVSCAEEDSRFTVVKSQFNKYNQSTGADCVYQINGNGASKGINVSSAPEALFEAAGGIDEICENQDISIINLSTLGQYGTNGCLDIADYFWTIVDPNGNTYSPKFLEAAIISNSNNWMVDTNGDGEKLLDILIPADEVIPGCWSFSLKYINQDLCNTVSIFPEVTDPPYIVNVQAIPEPDFEFLDSSNTIITEICFGETVTFDDTSNLSTLGCQNPVYTWTIEPDAGYAFVAPFTINSQSPDVIFNEPGVYNVTQSIENTCGFPTEVTKEITILGDPTVEFTNISMDACEGLSGQTFDGFTLDFLNNGAISPTYSEMPYEPMTFLWTITGVGVTAADYTFVSGTDADSDFPVINFLNYKTYIITVMVNGNCANSNTATFTFIYEQTPIITNTDTLQTLCPGETTIPVAFTSDMDPSTTYSIFINPNPAISGNDPSLTSGGFIPAMTLTNSTNIPQDLVYSVVPTVDNCSGGTRNFTFTVNPVPVIPELTDAICSEETFTVVPVDNSPTMIVPAGTTYVWTVVDIPEVTGESNQSTPQNSISQTLINTTEVVQTVVYTVTPTSSADGNCVGDSFILNVQVDPKPSIDDVILTALCSGNAFDHLPVQAGGVNGTDVIPVSTSYTWTVLDANGLVTGDSDVTVGQTSIGQTLTNNSSVTQTLVYTVTPTSGDQGTCIGNTFTVTIDVNPAPVIPTQTAEICSEETFTDTLADNPPTTIIPAGTTYLWTVGTNTNVTGQSDVATSQTSISQTLTNLSNIIQTVVYTVTPTSGADGNCIGDDFILNVQVNPRPIIDDVTLTAICSGEAFNHLPIQSGGDTSTDLVPANTTYTWTVVDANGLVTGDSDVTVGQTSIGQTLTNISEVPQTLIYTVTPTSGVDGNCVGATFTLTITLNPEPVIPAQSAAICSEETFSAALLVNNPATTIIPTGTTYVWTVGVNTNVIGQSDETTPQTSESQTLTNLTNTVQTLIYTVTPTSGAAGNCVGDDFTITVDVNPKPLIGNVDFPAICSGTPFDLIPTDGGGLSSSDIVPAATTYTWTVVDANGFVTGGSDVTVGQTSIGQTLTNTSNVTQTVIYTVTPTSGAQGNCEGETFTVSVDVNPTPSISAIPSQTICGGTAFVTPTFVSDVTGATYTWLLTNGAIPAQVTGYPSPNGNGDITGGVIENTGTASYTLVYDVIVDFQGCAGNTEQFSITVEPAPSVNFDVLDQSVCSGGNSVLVNLSSLTPSVAISWSIDSTLYPNITGINQLTGTTTIPAYTLSNSGTVPIELIFVTQAVTTTAGSCVGASVEYSIIVNPAAEMDAVNDLDPKCNGETITEITFTTPINEGTTEYNWIIDTNIGLTPLTGTGPIPAFTAINTTSDPIIATVTVDPVFRNDTDPTVECDGVQQVFTITINPSPQITNAVTSETICSEDDSSAVEWSSSIINGTPTTYSWTFVSATAGITGHLTDPGTSNLPVFPFLSNTSNAVGALVYEVIPSSLGCTGTPFLYTIFINPVIAITNAPASQTLCNEDTSAEVVWENTNSALAVSYTWAVDPTTVPAGTTGLVNAGVGNLPAMTLAIIGNVTANINYIVTPTFDSCGGTPYTYTLIVEPRPTMDPILPQTICGGSAFTTPTLGADVVGTVYDWELLNIGAIPATVTGYPTDTTQALEGVVILNSGTAAYTLTYEFTPSFNGCDGPTIPFDITINPSPIVTLTLDTQEVCSDAITQAFTASSLTDPATTYQWSVTSGAAALDGGDPTAGITNQIPSFTVTNTGLTPIDIVIEVTASTTGSSVCPGTASVHTITVFPDPTIAIISAVPTAICIGGTISDIEVATTGGTGVVSFEWFLLDEFGALGPIHPESTNSPSFNPGVFTAAGQYQFLAVASFTGNGCDQVQSITVFVEVVEDAVLSAPLATQTICEATAPTDLVVTPTGGTGNFSYQWFSNTTNTSSGGTIIAGAINPIFTPDTTTAGTVYYYCVVTTDASGCETFSTVSEVIVNEGPSINAQPLAIQTVCLDEVTTTLEVEYINGVGIPTYQWFSGLTCDTTDLSNPILGETTSTFTPPSTAVASTNYFVILTFADGGCGPIVSECALVNVGEIPVIDNVQLTICAGAPFNVVPTNGGGINATDIVPSTTEYTWTVTGSGFISGAVDNPTQAVSISQTLENATNTVQQVVYTVTPISTAVGTCIGDTFTITVSVNPTPTIANTTLEVCSETPFSYSASGDGSAGTDSVPVLTTYTWTVVDNINIQGETPDNTGTATLDQTLINISNTPQPVVYTVTPISNFGCVGEAFTLTVTVDPVPLIFDTTADICSGETFMVSPVNDMPTEIVPDNTTYTWTVAPNLNVTGWSDVTVGEATISQTLLNTNPLDIDEFVTYTVTPTSDGCVGNTFDIIVRVIPNPVVSVSIPTQTACSGDLFSQVNFSSSVPNTTYQYDLLDPALVPAGIAGYAANTTGVGISFPALTLTNTTTDPFTLVYSVTPLSDGCNGLPLTFELTINPSPGIIFSELDQEICDLGTSVSVTLTSPSPNVDIQWTTTVPVGLLGVSVLAGTDEIPVYTLDNTLNTPIDLVFTVTATTDDPSACQGAEFTYIITVNPTTTIDAIADQIICSRYDFTDVNITSPTTPLGSLTYAWVVTAAGPNLSGFTTNSGPIAFATPISGETIFNASNLAEDLVYTLTPFFNGCPGDTQQFTITVNPTPEIFAMVDTICSEETFDVNPTNGVPTNATIVPANTSYTWTVVDVVGVSGESNQAVAQTTISQTLVNETNTPQDVVYIVTPSSALGCVGPSFELTVSIETRPVISDKTDGICSGDTFVVSPVDNSPTEIVPANTLYTWTITAGPDLAFLTGYSDVTIPTAPISQTLVNLTDDVRTIVYIVTPSSGGCEGLPFELEVTLSPRPFVEDVIVDPICSDDTFVVSPQTGVPNATVVVPLGTTYTWTVIDNTNVLGDSDETVPQPNISQILTNTSSSTQTVEYTVTPLSNGCAGVTFQVSVDVKPRPFIVAGLQTQDTQCSGSPFVIFPEDGIPTAATIVPVGTQYTWVVSVTNTNLTGWSDQLIAVNAITQTLINTTNTIQQITYTITPEVDGCVGPAFDAIITIEPKPFVPNVIADICDANSFTLSPVNGVTPDATTIIPDVTLYTWGVPTVTGGISGTSIGVDEVFFDSGVLDNPTIVFQTAVYTITPIYYKAADLTTPQCIGDPFTVTITVSPSPEINEVITNIACSFSDLCGASIEITPEGILPFSYNWTSLEGNPIADPTVEDLVDLCPGTYQLDITDGSNCTYTFQYLIEPPTPVEFTLERLVDISCNNVEVPPCDGYIEMTITGGTLPYRLIEWYTETIPDSGIFDAGPFTNSTNSLELFNACEGNYVLKVLDGNGCLFVSDTHEVEQLNTPVVLDATVSDFNGFNIDCTTANTGFVSVDLSGGSGVYNYSFVDGTGTVLFAGGILAGPATILFDNLVAGDYTLTVEDPNCPNLIVRNYTFTEPTPLLVTATLVNPILCFGELATYEVTATGGVPPYLGTGFVEVLSGLAVFVVTDSNGCEHQDATVVTEPTEMFATAIVTDALCFGDTGSLVVMPTGGTGILTVSLFDAANLFMRSLLTTQGVSVQFDAFDGTYFYNVVDANNCVMGPMAMSINEPDPIEIVTKVITQPDCNTTPAWAFDNGSICLTITGGTNPFPVGAGWVDNGGGVWCLTGLSAGTYPLDVTDINGCPLFVPEPDAILTRPPEITAFFTNSLDINCTTDTATETSVIFVNGGVPPYEITWSGGVWNPATQEVMETTVAGTYTAFVNDQFGIANGCPPIPFVLNPISFLEFGISDFTMTSLNSDFCDVFAIDDPVNFQNTSTGDVVGFTWNFGDGSAVVSNVDAPTHIYDELGVYTIELTVEDAYGCFDTYSETIDVTKGYEIILPTAFTPNADGINDTMRPVFNCMVKIEMSVYDTWGSLLYFESGDTITGWDGTIDGNPTENGNYIIVVTAQTFNGITIEMNGPITLIK